MGKQKRMRTKFHLASVRWKEEGKKEESKGTDVKPELQTEVQNTEDNSWGFASMDNLFKGIDIDVDKLRKNLEEDVMSVKSIAKSIKEGAKGRHLKKLEKRKLRHELFIRKIDNVYKEMNSLKKGNQKKGKVVKESVDENEENLNLPTLSELAQKKETDSLAKDTSDNNLKKNPKGKKPILKAKQRQKALLKDIECFKKVMSNPDFKENPLVAVSEFVKEKVLGDEI